MKQPIKFVWVIIALSIFAFSSAHEESQWKGKIEYEDGVKVIINPNEPLYGEIEFDLEEDLSIGNEEDENYVFYRATGISVDSEGNILILDSGNFRLQKYNKNGNYLQTIGRQGQGPGEFESPRSLYIDAKDNFYIEDSFKRIETFDKNGVFKKRIKLKTDSALMRSLGFMSGGNFIARTSSRRERNSDMPGDYDSFLNIDLISQDGATIKTVASYRLERSERIKNDRGGYLYLNNLCKPFLWFCPINKEMAVYGFSSEYELFVINSSGELEYIIKKDELPQPVTEAEKDKVIDRIMGIPMKLSRRKIAGTIRFPKYKPFYREIIKDDKDRIYVEKFKFPFDRGDSVDFDIFSKDGYYLYKAKIPARYPFYPPVIKNGYDYTREIDLETGYIKIKRYKIKNWDQIRTGL